jgi:ubiquinone/menaquinone biosynthesis C-methylase UbiE
MEAVNYDRIADHYDDRYKSAYQPKGIASKLANLIQEVNAEKVLEVGCGTGHWLELLEDKAKVFGIDLSWGMLQKAAARKGKFFLIKGEIAALPFSARSFDLVYCVNALHHFQNPSKFIVEAHKLLRPTGALTVIGMNPQTGQDRWFIYDYFPGTLETDLKRYPSAGTIVDWMISAGFNYIDWQIGERIVADRQGQEVLQLSKDFTSQLTLLSEEEYKAGKSRIETALRESVRDGKTIIFPVDISLSMVTGRV